MIGSLINAAGIILACALWLIFKRSLSVHYQSVLKVGLGAATVFFGLKLTFTSLHGSPGQILKQFGIVLLSMTLGKLVGKLLHLQKMSNSMGRYASQIIMTAPTSKEKFNSGFLVSTILFCAAPLAVFASVQEGLNDWSPLFVVKALMDGAAAMAFAAMFGWGILLSAIPVLAFQAALTRGTHLLLPWLLSQPYPMVDTINAINGLLITTVALIILQLKKVEVTDYLPSLVLGPLLVRWLW
jgi:uncharacterized protein